MRRFGQSPLPDRRYTPRPGAYAILWGKDGLLLTHQSDPTPEFQLPGGGVDPGEHVLPALHREVLEETGWTMSKPRRLGVFRRFTYMPEYDRWADKVCTVFLARPVLRLGPPLETGHTAVWMSPEAAIEALANDGDRQFLIDLLNRG